MEAELGAQCDHWLDQSTQSSVNIAQGRARRLIPRQNNCTAALGSVCWDPITCVKNEMASDKQLQNFRVRVNRMTEIF